jgi:predicted dehydrogenase
MGEIKFSRILIIGTGTMGFRHFEIVRKLFPEAQIAVYSESGRNSHFAHTLTTKSEIESFRPEISVVANQSSRHLDVACYLAELGSHLLIEKPLSSNLDGIDQLIAMKNRSNLKLAVGYNLRFLPSFRIFHSLLKKNTVGRIFDVRIEVGQSLETWRPERDYRETTSARRIDGGGVLRELSHEIDYLIEFFGPPKWVSASIGRVSDLEIDVEDIAHLILGMENEDGTEFMASMHLDFVRQDKTRRCTVIGSDGTLEWNLLSGRIVQKNSDFSEIEVSPPNQELVSDTYTLEWKELIAAISQDLEPTNSLQNSAKIVEVILACEKSQRSESKVRLFPLTGVLYG